MNDPVDVLIIGAGASGAAVAWSFADTRMHILCLEQGGWMNPATYPSTGRDWEARAFGDYSPSPKIRAPARGLSDQRQRFADQGRELQRRGWRHGDVQRRTFRACILPISASTALDGVRRLADRLRHARPHFSKRTTG